MTSRPTHPAPGHAPHVSRLRAAALHYAANGWPVLPLHTPTRDGRCSCDRHDCPKPGKHPRNRHGLRDATLQAAQVRTWWTRWPHANIGIATGRLLILDIDGDTGHAALAALERAHAPLPSTLAASTGRGAHLYFDAGERRIANSAGRLGECLDVRGRGGYAVVPPSLHAHGHRYRWINRAVPEPLPEWLAELLIASAPAPRRTPLPDAIAGDRRRRYFAAALHAELGDVAAAAPGTRNDTLNRAAFRLAQLAAAGHGTLDELTGPLLDAALAAGLTEAEALTTIASGLRAGQQHPRPTAASALAATRVHSRGPR